MKLKPSVLECVLATLREGDLDECVRHVRTLVDAAPQASAPRQLLAALFAHMGNGRVALAHYQRLLPQAVGRAELLRSITFQKQIDAFQRPELHPPVRWAVLQTQLRGQGVPHVPSPPGASGRPWTEAQLLALSRAWFERIAEETRVEFLGLEPRTVDIEAGTVWEVIGGRMRWSFALADGRASAESLAAEGDAVHVDPGLGRTVRLTYVPELPIEILCFDAPLARELKATLSPARPAAPGMDVFVQESEARALLPTRPRKREDLDERLPIPEPAPRSEPPRLAPVADDPAFGAPTRDTGDWVEYGVLSLSDASGADEPAQADVGAGESGTGHRGPAGDTGLRGPSAGDEDDRQVPAEAVEPAEAPAEAAAGGHMPAVIPPPEEAPAEAVEREEAPDEVAADDDMPAVIPAPEEAPAEAVERAEAPAEPSAPEEVPMAGKDSLPPAPERERILHLPPLEERPLHTGGRRRVEEPEPIESYGEPEELPAADPFAAPIAGPEPQFERRRHPRMVISLESRVALLRLSGARVKPVRGQLNDLSTSGLSVRFANHALGTSRTLLADAVVAVELAIPGPGGALRVAAQVRWLDHDREHDETRIGIEFVLLTEPDRRRIAGTLARAALAAYQALRRVA